MMLKYLIQTSIFRYSKNYGSLTHETRIKDVVNMGDLICLLATVRTINLFRNGGGESPGHSNMKVTFKCLYRRTKIGGVRCKISSKKRGSFGVGTKKMGAFFGVGSQKLGSFSVQKCNFKAEFANFLLKLPQNRKISQNARVRKNLQFLCKI